MSQKSSFIQYPLSVSWVLTRDTLNLGASTILGRDTLLNVTAGIGVTEDAPDYSIGISLLVRTDALIRFLRDR